MYYYQKLRQLGSHGIELPELQSLMDEFNQSHAQLINDVCFDFKSLKEGESVTLNVGGKSYGSLDIDQALDVLTKSVGFQWAGGLFLIPTLCQLTFAGFFQDAERPIPLYKRHIALQGSDKTFGVVWGACHLLGLQGWLRISGTGMNVKVHLSGSGKAVKEFAEKNSSKLQQILEGLRWLRQLNRHIRHRDGQLPKHVKEIFKWALADWNDFFEDYSADPKVIRQLRSSLDGLLVAPSLVALSMPQYSKEGGRINQIAPPIIEELIDNPKLIRTEVGRTVVEYLAHQGIFDLTRTKPTRVGQSYFKSAPYIGALATSYLPSYLELKKLTSNDPDPLAIDRDGHIDRVMNIFGSSGAGSGPAFSTISEEILAKLFDETPLDQQPYGIADMGCGDGKTLFRLAEYIIHNTKRGERLSEFPLHVIGADFNNDALGIADDNLKRLRKYAHVHTHTVQADVSNPEEYASRLAGMAIRVEGRENGVGRRLELSDLLHTFMFIVHNRRLASTCEERAETILSASLAEVDGQRLKQISDRLYGQQEIKDLDQVVAAFPTVYTSGGPVLGHVVAADLIAFLKRWRPYSQHGMVMLEAHSPWNGELESHDSDDEAQWSAIEKTPHIVNWGMHFVSQQFLMPFKEFRLALELAGLQPLGDQVYGKIHGKGIPSIDYHPTKRFFSIGCYTQSDFAGGTDLKSEGWGES